MNPILDMLGLQSPAEMKGLQVFGGDKAALNGKLEGLIFSEILGMGMSEKNAGEVLNNLFAANPEGIPEEPGKIPEFVLPEIVTEEPTAAVQEPDPENPQAGDAEKEPVSIRAVPDPADIITAPPIEEVDDSGEIALASGKNVEAKPVQPDNPVQPLLILNPVQTGDKAAAGMQEMNPEPDFTAYKQNAGFEPVVTVEKGLEPLVKEVSPDDRKAIESFKTAVNLKEIDINSIVKPQKNENSGPVKVAFDIKPEEFLKQTGTLDKGDGQSFDLNRQDNPQVSLKELAVGREKEIHVGKEQFKAAFDVKPAEIKTETHQTATQAKVDADFSVTHSGSAASNGTQSVKVDIPAVRFTVPPELNDDKSLHNRTVMIKMEPDNLGPIRMTLTSVHDNLSARLVVDSSAAKSAVESNLHQLADQLNRQGIKIEFFEISVGGSHVGEDTGDRNPARFAGEFGRARRGFGQYEANGVSSGITDRVRQYIGAGGVNCFA